MDELGIPLALIALAAVGAFVATWAVSERAAVAERERQLADAHRLARLGSYEWDLDRDRVWWSDELYRLIGVAPHDVTPSAEAFMERIHPDDRAAVEANTLETFASGTETVVEFRLLRPDGDVLWVRGTGRVVADGRGRRLAGAVQDISEARRADERFRALVQHAPDIIAVFDESGVVSYASPALARILGHDPNEITGFAQPGIVHASDLETVALAFTQAREQDGVPVTVEFRAQHRDGTYKWLEATFTSLVEDTDVRAVVINARDISERRSAAAALAHQAMHDPLTDLPNRALFLDRTSHALARSRRRGTGVAVMFVDLDGFKEVNDAFGHTAGDNVLRSVASILETVVRSGDTVARLGGDEFVVCCEDLESEVEAVEIAERLTTVLQLPFGTPRNQFNVTASIGIVLASGTKQESADSLLRDSDAAMYQAKQRGRNRWEIFDQDMRSRAAERVDMERRLSRAIDRSEIELVYQPVIEMASGRVAGVEALVRWDDPAVGRVMPADFIPLAEESGLIHRLGELVIESACWQAAVWNHHHLGGHPLSVAVNLSARQLDSDTLPAFVEQALSSSGLDPELLCLEITETALMGDAELVASRLGALKRLGVQLAVDDFGTGYSSLLYLRRFPVDILKVDRSFVAGLGTSDADSAIVEGVIRLAHALGLQAIAEGVETRAQQYHLAALGCDVAQGYRWSEPLSVGAMRRWLQRYPTPVPRWAPAPAVAAGR